MRVLIVHRVDRAKASVTGIGEKIADIKKGFIKIGWQVDELCPFAGSIAMNGEKIGSGILFFGDEVFKHLSDICIKVKYDVVYIRFAPLSFHLYAGLEKLRRHFKGKVLMEFPNYPFQYEYGFAKNLAYQLFLHHKWSRLNDLVDYALHLGPEKEIFGIPTIKFDNGFHTERVNLRKPAQSNQKVCTLLFVGSLWKWQGLENLFEALRKDKQRDVIRWRVIIIGQGPQKDSLMKKAKELQLDDVVTFLNPIHGNDLDDVFDKANVGIGTLQNAQRKLGYAANLKHRHYASRGLPFFYNVPDLGFDACTAGHLQMSLGEIDLDKLAIWFESNNESMAQTSLYLRTYAKEHFAWDQILAKVLEQIK